MNTIRFNKCAARLAQYGHGQCWRWGPLAKTGVRQEMIAASIDDRDDNDNDQKHNAFNEDVCLGGSVGVDV